MTPRSRARASTAASGAQSCATVDDLPDGVLIHALGFLGFQQRCAGRLVQFAAHRVSRCVPFANEQLQLLPACRRRCRRRRLTCPTCRRQHVALVSKRFAALCSSPALLQDASVYFSSLSGADSAAAWLMRHGRLVRQLRLAAEAQAAALDADPDAQLVASLTSAVATSLAVAGMASQLAELAVLVNFDLHTGWLRTMRVLRWLSLSSDDALQIAPAIAELTALQSLELYGFDLQIPAETRLPVSITRLRVDEDCSPEMPQQASRVCCASERLCISKACQAAVCLPHPNDGTLVIVLPLAFAPMTGNLKNVLPRSCLARSLLSCPSCSGSS